MKKKKIVLLFFLIFSFLLTGCSNTSDFEAVVDPAYTEKVDSILVMFRTGDIKITKDVESYIVNKLKENNVDSYESYKLIPLTKQYSEKEFSKRVSNAINENNIESILFVTVKNIKTDKTKIDTYNNYQQNSTPNNAFTAFLQGYAQGVDGSEYETIEMDIEVRLYNIKKEGIAWRGMVSGSSSNYTNDTGKENIISIMEKATEKLVNNLSQNNLI